MQRKRIRRRMIILIMMFAFSIAVSSCGDSASADTLVTQDSGIVSGEGTDVALAGKNKKKDKDKDSGAQMTGNSNAAGGSYEAPEFAESEFHTEEAEGNDSVQIDLSATDEGYVAVSAHSEQALKFQVLEDDQTYTYDLPSDGTPGIFPLQCGDGTYTFRVMENVSGTKYAMLYNTEAEVELTDEFQPFIRPSAYADYDQNSECVKKAEELAAKADDAVGVIAEVYNYICDTVSYDKEKAATVNAGYLPTPDETLKTGKGICFDYASLAAAMLRSQGIPTKVIFGYVSPDDLYHAWNMFYTEDTGWVTVEFQVDAKNWNRLDLTFAANGADNNFIGNGDNYTDVYFY